ncbi:MAG TPA: preprotein translocase subunit SecA [Patescibacteria group bacterium]|jgi:preprotein translocase subunit SecA|nr:preprotein translocase subunit SecA [Patescibacteria group bacterium]
MKKVLTKIFGDPQAKIIKRLKKRVIAVNNLAEHYKAMSVPELKKQPGLLREQLQKKTLEDILPEAFAVMREASDRVLKERHFDVQLIAGMALHEGNVAEMKTGEGKTLMATLPSFLNALAGKGVHVVTVNDYLAQRDAGWMGSVYDFLGMKTGVIIADQSYLFDAKYDNDAHTDPRMRKLRPCTRKEAYAADITYGTNNEFGFDYLRDNMVNEVDLLRQRELNFAIVDEVDSILIDEARTPLIISAPASDSGTSYNTFATITKKLVPEDYVLDEKRKAVSLTDMGVEKVQKLLGIKNLYDPDNVKLVYHIDQALRAETLYKRDKSYVVTSDKEVIIVDEFTGRLMHGRRYNEGLHQAIEAKEQVPVLQESMTLATISFQNYFRLYNKLSGMTGTAFTEAEEFQQIYGLDVIQIPSNKPIARDDRPDMIFKTEAGKFRAIVKTVKEYNQEGRPVLIGSASIDKNEELSRALTKAGVVHEILNAKNNEREAAIVAAAGQKGAVTLATNIAGRGTDIVLGEGVRELGGLVVVGSERHEARRIDNQLRGRCGRQGDPGLTQFYVSTEDDLMRIFQGERIATLMDRLGVDDDTPIQNRAVSKTLESAQKKVEGYHFDTRKNVVQYDNVMNRHRKAVYVIRRKILESGDISDRVKDLVAEQAAAMTNLWPKEDRETVTAFESVIPLDKNDFAKIRSAKEKERSKVAMSLAQKRYGVREQEFGPETMRKLEREIYLQVLDTLWMQHLENMSHLRDGIHWRSVGQRDPLVEYRQESQRVFDQLQLTLRSEVVRAMFHITKRDAAVEKEENFDTELTRAAERAVEQGVNEIAEVEHNVNFDTTTNDNVAKKKKDDARKKRKKERQNKKKHH